MTLGPDVRLALDWLCASGVRLTTGQWSGGVCQGYDWRRRAYPFVYFEITGYAVSLLLLAWRWTGDARYLELALESAGVLVRGQSRAEDPAERGGFPHSLSLPDLVLRRHFYAFDTAMCMQGLLDVHAATADARWLDAATEAAVWLRGMQRGTGAFQSMYDGETGARDHPGLEFFDDDGALHAKHAIALLRHWRATQDGASRDSAASACNWALTLQNADGSFRATERLDDVVTHAHCYAVEGLLVAYDCLRDERYLAAAVRGAGWLAEKQARNGSLAIVYRAQLRVGRHLLLDRLRPRAVTDATAQAIRIWLLIHAASGQERFLAAARRAAGFLRQQQCRASHDAACVGGYFFGAGRHVMFSWATMFAVHGLHLLDRLGAGRNADRLIDELF